MRRLILHGSLVLCLSLTGCGGQFFAGNQVPSLRTVRVAGVEVWKNGEDTGAMTAAKPILVNTNSNIYFIAEADDPDRDPITFNWVGATAIDGTDGALAKVENAPAGSKTYTLVVKDDRTGATSLPIYVVVEDPGANHGPVAHMDPATAEIKVGDSVTVHCVASDVDNDTLQYFFATSKGTIVQDPADPSKATYTATEAGDQTIYCVVADGKGASVVATEVIKVKP
jgi:hypothetical protein